MVFKTHFYSPVISVSWEHTQQASQFSAVRCGNMALPKRL